MNILNEITPEKIDMLREAGNIGSGNAVTSLSTLLGQSVDMSIATVNIKKIEELNQVLGDEENYIAAMLIEVYGELKAMLLLALEADSAYELVKRILQKEGLWKEESDFNEFDYSVLSETGNILAGAYLNALSTLANLELIPSVPQTVIDMAGAILSFTATEFTQEENAMMFIETKFKDSEELLNGTYILILNQASLERITDSLGRYYE
ncbi:chemotaxis protein CheC [Niameybacter massiliensis]|uniref:Chemotaxis protein CheC n=1 Tax=Holtiella tumoricola TaxID=3018743 RepID=A0AA42DPT8_9FIRM|nr:MULTISPECIES: chemotaxis protein CheC [Lachnospirales]MDA3732611.1 chemotaxis protein CheC [Holtiella tumoricola]